MWNKFCQVPKQSISDWVYLQHVWKSWTWKYIESISVSLKVSAWFYFPKNHCFFRSSWFYSKSHRPYLNMPNTTKSFVVNFTLHKIYKKYVEILNYLFVENPTYYLGLNLWFRLFSKLNYWGYFIDSGKRNQTRGWS